MRAKTFIVNATAGGVTYSPAYPVDTYNNPCNIGIGVIASGSVVYDVQHTFSDPWSINLNGPPVAGSWLNNATLTSATASGDTNYAFPPRAIRFVLRAGTGQITGTIQQAGPEE